MSKRLVLFNHDGPLKPGTLSAGRGVGSRSTPTRCRPSSSRARITQPLGDEQDERNPTSKGPGERPHALLASFIELARSINAVPINPGQQGRTAVRRMDRLTHSSGHPAYQVPAYTAGYGPTLHSRSRLSRESDDQGRRATTKSRSGVCRPAPGRTSTSRKPAAAIRRWSSSAVHGLIWNRYA